jgi:hypothetical protein
LIGRGALVGLRVPSGKDLAPAHAGTQGARIWDGTKTVARPTDVPCVSDGTGELVRVRWSTFGAHVATATAADRVSTPGRNALQNGPPLTRAHPLALVDLLLANPATQRVRHGPDPRTDPQDRPMQRKPRILRPSLQDHPHRTLPQLLRVLPTRRHDPNLSWT